MKEYKSLFIKIVIFLVVIVAVDFCCGKLFRLLELKALDRSPYGMPVENAMWKVDKDVVIIGASEACHSIIPQVLEDSLGLSVCNCGQDGCRFYIQNAMINGLVDRYSPKMILWSVSPTLLRPPSEQDKGKLSLLNPFYRDKLQAREALKTKSRYEPIKLLSQSYVYNSRLMTYCHKIIMPDKENESNGYVPLHGCIKDKEIQDREWNRNFDTVVTSVFLKTITKCKLNNVQVVLVFVPRFANDNYQQEETYIELKKIVEEHGIDLIEDFYHYDALMDAKYFKDVPHLNEEGAVIFSSLLSSKINKLSTPN